MSDRYTDLDFIVTILELAQAKLEEADPHNRSDDIAGYRDKLSDMIAEAEKERDGEPLEQELARQARDDHEMRDWHQARSA